MNRGQILLILTLLSPSVFAAGPFSKVDVTGEVDFDLSKSPGEKPKFATDGPAVEVNAEVAKNILPVSMQTLGTWTLAGTFQVNEALRVEDSKFKAPIAQGKTDWNNFFHEAKVILDVDPQSGIPFATVIKRATLGIQDIETGSLDSRMPIDDNSPLRGITRVRSAKAFRIDLNNENFETLALAAYKTGAHHSENFGENMQPSSPGVTLMMTKKFSDRWTVNGAISKIKFPEKSEVRINSGIAYENPQGGYKVFYNGAKFKNNPLYPDATTARTLGVIKDLNDGKWTLNLEKTRLNNGYNEKAWGIVNKLTDSTFLAAGVRSTPEGRKYEIRLGATK